MRPEDIRDFNRRQPFQPYRIHVTGGQTYDIKHPDQVIVLRSRLTIGLDNHEGISEKLEPIALIHIIHIEELEATEV